jgi:hypothetical protein
MNARSKPGSNDEPEVSTDESVPLDGKDPVGEKMMEGLGSEMKTPDEAKHGGEDSGRPS